MKAFSSEFNVLQTRRYSLTFTHNATQVTSYGGGTASSSWELTMNHTYQQLCENLGGHFDVRPEVSDEAADRSGLQQYRNHLSSLNGFLASVGKTVESRVGTELGHGFDEALRVYLDGIQVAPRTKRDRINHLKLIRRLHEAARQPSAMQTPPVTSLSAELRIQVARSGLAPKALAKKARISPSALSRWLKGASLNRRGVPSLRRLERTLGLQRDHLVALIHDDKRAEERPRQAIAFRTQLRARTEAPYRVPEEGMSAELKVQWRAFFDYKVTPAPLLERHPRGQWRCVPLDTAARLSPLAQRGTTGCAAADAVLPQVRGFLGFLQLSATHGGRELSPQDVQTMAWLAHPEMVNDFLEFMRARAGGLTHAGHQRFAALVASLVREETGYLLQRPELAATLPDAYRPASAEAWKTMCARAYKVAAAWKAQAKDVSRRPEEPIADLLSLQQPLLPVLEAIATIEQAAANAPSGSLMEARLRRDALLLAMLLANPLRARNWITMTWRGDGSGSLYRTPGGGYRIRLPAHAIKNGQSKAGKTYDVKVADWVVPMLDAYVEEYRHTLLDGAESPYLFISSRTHGKWLELNRQVSKLTARYIPGSPGFGPHAFRHLVATDFLMRNPNAFQLCAELLNDSLATVLREYAHLKRDDSFSHHEAHINGLLEKRGRANTKKRNG